MVKLRVIDVSPYGGGAWLDRAAETIGDVRPASGEVWVIRTHPADDVDGPSIASAGTAISGLFGSFLRQDAEGNVEREVTDRGPQVGAARFSATSGPAPMHTDGMHMPGQPPPDFFSLTCIQQAGTGGQLQICSLGSVLKGLPDRDAAVTQLRRPYHFHTKGIDPQGRQTVVRPVLQDGGGCLRVQYAREYIDLGHGLAESPPLDSEQRAALDLFDEALLGAVDMIEMRLERGDVAVIDNATLLHGRSGFTDDPGSPPRRMLRYWMQTSGS